MKKVKSLLFLYFLLNSLKLSKQYLILEAKLSMFEGSKLIYNCSL